MRAPLDYPGIGGDLGRIACPTGVIYGREEQTTPVATHDELAGEIPGAKLSLVQRAAHFTPLETPHAVAGVLRDWLRV